MSLFIQFFIIISLHFRVASRWNYSFHSNFRSKFNYTSTVIALIWYQVFHFKILNQFLCTRAIVHVSVGYEYFQWHAPSCIVPFWDRHALISTSCTTCVHMTFHVCRINHNIAQIRLIRLDFNILSQIPRSRHRVNRRCVFSQSPYSFGKSRHDAPVSMLQSSKSRTQR